MQEMLKMWLLIFADRTGTFYHCKFQNIILLEICFCKFDSNFRFAAAVCTFNINNIVFFLYNLYIFSKATFRLCVYCVFAMDGVGVMTPMGNSCFLEGATCTIITRRGGDTETK